MTSSLDDTLVARVEQWIADDPDAATAAEAAELLERARGGEDDPEAAGRAAAELADRFSGLLTFGTAGLRGRLGAGPNRMNRAVVIRAAAALTDYLRSDGQPDPPRVVVGYDARRGSAEFARDTAAVVTAAGGSALLLPSPLPTPVLAFAVRHLGAEAGVMVTASHNPAGDNGFKVYLGGRIATGPDRGVQLVPPADAEIAARMTALASVRDVPRAGSGWQVLDEDVVDAYLARVARTVPGSPRTLRLALTPLHGVGGTVAVAALAGAGFRDVHVVAEQAEPDPDFPTTPFPNPEEPGALDRVLAAAAGGGAQLALALDPDADRCAVALPAAPDGGWRVLTGDEVGALLGDRAARELGSAGRDGARGVLASSVVSSRMLARIAAAYGVRHVTTLTGFKWIARVPGLVFGYEEALGYCADPEAVRDKDGIAAAVRIAALADDLARDGRTLADALDDLARAHGLHLTAQVGVRVEDLGRIAAIMARLRGQAPRALGGDRVVEASDLAAGAGDLPPADALVYLTAAGDRVIVRPSGTEPRLKCYLEVVEPVRDRDVTRARTAAVARMTALRSDVRALLGS